MSSDAELDALIVRNIADLGAALKHAVEKIGPLLWKEAGRATTGAVSDDGWFAFAAPDPDAEEVWFARKEWLLPDRSDPDADFWLGLDERTDGDADGESSWLAAFVNAGPEGSTMAFWVDQRIVGKAAWKRIVKSNGELVEALRGSGFSLHLDDDRRLCLPIVLDREMLALAFENDDFDAVMAPVAAAVRNAATASPHLDRLRDLAREAA